MKGRGGLELVVSVPVLRRAHRVAPLIESLHAATPEPHRVVFVASANDRPMIDEVLRVAGAKNFDNWADSFRDW